MWNWLDKVKQKNNLWSNTLRFLYSWGKIEWLWDIIGNLILLFIPICWIPSFKLAIVLLCLFPFCVAFKYICLNYKKHSEYESSRIFRVLDLQSEAISSIACLVEESPTWQDEIFQRTSEIVCSKIHDLFLSELDLKTRVSVEYVEHRTENNFIIMVGRQSYRRQNGKRTKVLSEKKAYFIYKVFENNNEGVNILEKAELKDENYWHRNHDVDVRAYWGIAVADNQRDVKFVIQIDFLDDLKMDEQASMEFIKLYLNTFTQTLRFAYLQDSNIIR